MENKPAGAVYTAIASKDTVKVFYFELKDYSRNELRTKIVNQMIELLIDEIEQGATNGS
jgi:nicotinamide mononucleotide (NMN) deamidase PncC